MVAEPVQVARSFLDKAYNSIGEFVAQQLEKLPLREQVWGLGSPEPRADSPVLAWDRISTHLDRHRKSVVGGVALGIGISGVILYKNRGSPPTKLPRRRVPKLPNGARRHVILLVGSPTEPMTRLVALDFERRGFIVYLTILDEKDSRYIQSNSITDDVNYLNLIGLEDMDYRDQMTKFRKLFDTDVVPFDGAKPHRLQLAAVVFAPALYFPLLPLENIGSASWRRLMFRLSAVTSLFGSGLLDLVRSHRAAVIGVVPNIVSTLRMPYHGPEVVLQNALKDVFAVLAKELAPQNINVTQIRLGNLHLGSGAANKASRTLPIIEAEVRSWSLDMQLMYGAPFQQSQNQSRPMGTPLRTAGLRGLYHLLFDLVFSEKKNPQLVYYGSGSRAYDILASILPAKVAQMLF